jgi:hypothetical protein
VPEVLSPHETTGVDNAAGLAIAAAAVYRRNSDAEPEE